MATTLDPIQVTSHQLHGLEKAYGKPKNMMEVFILKGIRAEMKERNIQNAVMNGIIHDESEHKDDQEAHEAYKTEADRFDMLLSKSGS